MTETCVDQQEHGYRSGHQLLGTSTKLLRADQDTVDRLSDMAGPLHPGETFSPYLTSYPLPSGSHYVLARTWQDLSAPRAGCVLTRSLVVPMALWENLENLTALLPLLLPPTPGEQLTAVSLTSNEITIPAVTDPRTIELVEALFLETRQPIVFFDTPNAEDISLRLLTSLWPGLRRSFSLCTFALAPRKIAGRDFDLQFAPKSARTRFSDWSGRRIEVGSTSSSRHRWSSIMATQMFEAEHPSLVANDVLGLLKADPRGDEATLRLTLLWNELTEKAWSSPTAVLGLLDILHSQHGTIQSRPEKLLPLVQRSIEVSRDEFPPDEAWQFFNTLAAKFPSEEMPTEVAQALRPAAAELANRDPAAAFRFLGQEGREQRPFALPLLDGAAEGLAASNSEVLGGLVNVTPDLAITLISKSQVLAGRLVSEIKTNPLQSLPLAANILEVASEAMRHLARLSLGPFLNSDTLAPLLVPLLSGATSQEIVDLAIAIGRNSDFAAAAFDKPLQEAAYSRNSLQKLRETIAQEFDSANSDRILISTLHASGPDVMWIREMPNEDRARRILVQVLQSASEYSVHEIMTNTKLAGVVIDLLAGDVAANAGTIASLLRKANIPIDLRLDVGESTLPFLPPEASVPLAAHLLSHALSESSSSDARVSELLERVGSSVPATELIAMATKEHATPWRVAENVFILEQASQPIRAGIVAHIESLSGRLANIAFGNLGQRAYITWAKLIGVARDHEARFRAASLALKYALEKRDFPVSPLVIVAFPIVYEELLKSKEGDERNIPAFFLLPLSFFVDWDRARSAREGLVEAFMHSSWPPADLIVTAVGAGLETWVLEQLSRSRGGRNYLSRIESDLLRLDVEEQRRIRKSVDRLLS